MEKEDYLVRSQIVNQDGYKRLIIGDDDDIQACLYYFRNDDGSIYIDDFSSGIKGGGKALVRELTRQIGPGQIIQGCIAEEGTLDVLKEAGYFNQVSLENQSQVIPADPALLVRLKLWRVFKGGGLSDITFTVIHNPDYPDNPVAVRFQART